MKNYSRDDPGATGVLTAYDELQQKGDKTPYAQILAETKQRDKQDSERAAAPLRQAADAVVLDTSGYTLEQSVEAILALVRRKLG